MVFDQVVVSTDSPKIAEIARKFGATVPFLRPPELSGSNARSEDVVTHFLSKNTSSEVVALLQPTSPLRTAHHIQKALELFQTSDAVGVVSGTITTRTDPKRIALSKCTDESWAYTPSVTFPTRWARMNGAIYVVNSQNFLATQSFLPGGTKIFLMDSSESIDIDEEVDFKKAESRMMSAVSRSGK